MVFMRNNKQYIVCNQTTFISDLQCNCSTTHSFPRALFPLPAQLDLYILSINVHINFTLFVHMRIRRLGVVFSSRKLGLNALWCLWEIRAGRSGTNQVSSSNFFRFPMLITFPPLLHTHLSPPRVRGSMTNKNGFWIGFIVIIIYLKWKWVFTLWQWYHNKTQHTNNTHHAK
jgi:hypothetical protein